MGRRKRRSIFQRAVEKLIVYHDSTERMMNIVKELDSVFMERESRMIGQCAYSSCKNKIVEQLNRELTGYYYELMYWSVLKSFKKCINVK